MTVPAPPGVQGLTPYPAPPWYGAPPWAYEHWKQVDRTRTGIVLLVLGALLAWIPYVGFVGGVLTLIGAILVIFGRKAFGPAHARNVIVSILLVVLGVVGAIALAIILALATVPFASASPPSRTEVQSAFNTFLIGFVVLGAITGLASVLFTYALQKPMGRALLWGGYAAGLAIQIAIFAAVAPGLGDAVAEAFATGSFNSAPLDTVLGRIQWLGLLGTISSALYAAAYYLVWQRIDRREIPAPPRPPAASLAPPTTTP